MAIKLNREKWKPCAGCRLSFLTQDGVFIEPVSDKILIYCRYCGRPLTDAAWAELEKKIRGCVE